MTPNALLNAAQTVLTEWDAEYESEKMGHSDRFCTAIAELRQIVALAYNDRSEPSQNADTVGQVVYDALGDELRLHDWKTWDNLSFEIKDRYRRIGQKVINALSPNDRSEP